MITGGGKTTEKTEKIRGKVDHEDQRERQPIGPEKKTAERKRKPGEKDNWKNDDREETG